MNIVIIIVIVTHFDQFLIILIWNSTINNYFTKIIIKFTLWNIK